MQCIHEKQSLLLFDTYSVIKPQLNAVIFGTAIQRLNSQTLRPVNVLGLLVFSTNTQNVISDIRDIKLRITAYVPL